MPGSTVFSTGDDPEGADSKKALATHSSAPIFRLDTDTLSLIFVILRDMMDDPQEFTIIQRTKTQIPMTICCVCSFWRAIAINSPLLWTTLVIIPPWTRKWKQIQLWLTRSQSCPIDLSVILTDEILEEAQRIQPIWDANGIPHNAEQTMHKLFKVLAPHLSRCRSIRIEDVWSGGNSVIRHFHKQFQVIDISLPFLEIFSLQGLYLNPGNKPERLCLSNASTPSLRRVDMGFPFTLPGHSLPQITSLHVNVHSVLESEFYQTLPQFHSLQTLAVYRQNFGYVVAPLLSPTQPSLTSLSASVSLPSLLSLQLYDGGLNYSLLSWISAPKLRELVIAPFHAHAEAVTQLCQSKPDRVTKFPALKTLAVAFSRRHELSRNIHLANLLATSFPGVEELTVVGNCVILLDAIKQYEPKETIKWPNLRMLAISDVGSLLVHDILSALVYNRQVAGVPLQKIALDASRMREIKGHHISLADHVEVTEFDSWRSIRSKGMFYPYHEFH